MTTAQKELVKGRLIDNYKEMVEKEWHTPFNSMLKLDANTIRCSYSMEVYWVCQKCQNIYRMSPRERVFRKYRNQESCFVCRGRRQPRRFTI